MTRIHDMKPGSPKGRERTGLGRQLTAGAVLLLLLVLGSAAGLVMRVLHTTGVRYGDSLILGPYYAGSLQLDQRVKLVLIPNTPNLSVMCATDPPGGDKLIVTVASPRNPINWGRNGGKPGAIVRRQWGFYIVESEALKRSP
jgi:hypothetical protein